MEMFTYKEKGKRSNIYDRKEWTNPKIHVIRKKNERKIPIMIDREREREKHYQLTMVISIGKI